MLIIIWRVEVGDGGDGGGGGGGRGGGGIFWQVQVGAG